MVITQVRLSEQALDLSLTTAKIAALAVTTAKIDNLAVTTAKLDNLSVSTGKIIDAAVTTAKIADANVTVAKLSDFFPSAGALLVLNVAAGRVKHNNVVASYAGGTTSVTDATTSYVEVNDAGTVSNNTTGFTSGRYPIATVVAAGGVITLVTDKRAWAAISLDEADSFVVRETPTGDLDGVDLTYTLAFTPIVGTEEVYLNGVLQNAGGNDYSISGSTITFVDAPVSTDKILVSYRK